MKTVKDFKKFRAEVVNFENVDKSLRKRKNKLAGGIRTIVPDNARARKYWHVRNATQNLMRELANFDECARIRLGSAYKQNDEAIALSETQIKNLEKWQKEFAEVVNN